MSLHVHYPKSSSSFRVITWQVNFRRHFDPPLFGNFRKHLTLLPSEISKKIRDGTKVKWLGLIYRPPSLKVTAFITTLLLHILHIF